MKKILISLCIVCFLGCSAFRPHRQQVTINTSAEDADVWINGRFAGKSPLSMRVKRNTNLSIIAKKKGYDAASVNIDDHLNTTGILDLIGCCIILLPGIGLFFPGASSLDETDIVIPMFPKEGTIESGVSGSDQSKPM